MSRKAFEREGFADDNEQEGDEEGGVKPPQEKDESEEEYDEVYQVDDAPENGSENGSEHDSPDEYEGIPETASRLTWQQYSWKHCQAYSELHGVFSKMTTCHRETIGRYSALEDQKEKARLEAAFCSRVDGLTPRLTTILNKAKFCSIMDHHTTNSKVVDDPRDRWKIPLAQLPDTRAACALGTLSLASELHTTNDPNPLHPDVIIGARAELKRVAPRTTLKDYALVVHSQWEAIEDSLPQPLSDYLPEHLLPSGKPVRVNEFHEVLHHLFDVISQNREPWAPNYPPPTKPPRWTPSSQPYGYSQPDGSFPGQRPQGSYTQGGQTSQDTRDGNPYPPYGTYTSTQAGGSGTSRPGGDNNGPQFQQTSQDFADQETGEARQRYAQSHYGANPQSSSGHSEYYSARKYS